MNLEFGKNLKRLRRERDMTQDELAEALSLSVQAISRYETGAAYPDIEMLPVMAGFFGTSVDNLLGVSSALREKRMDEYTEELRCVTDRGERLKILRRQHAEFPDAWDVVSDMAYNMTFLPEFAEELRKISEDAMKRCDDPMWRDNIMLHYLSGEPDDDKALEFIGKYATRYDLTPPSALLRRYRCRGNTEGARALKQFRLHSELTNSLYELTERDGMSTEEMADMCRSCIEFIGTLSGNHDQTVPDMWTGERLCFLLRLANNLFDLNRDDEGFDVLGDAVTLFENFFNLPNGTSLTYGTPKLECLSAKTRRQVFYNCTEFTGVIATSMVTVLDYDTPVGPTIPGDNMTQFEREYVFSSFTYDILKYAPWVGFARVKDDPRYVVLLERATAIAAFDNEDNIRFLLEEQGSRTDEWIADKEWVCALSVPGVGVYNVFGIDGDGGLPEIIGRMKREGNTRVTRIGAIKVGGGFIDPPGEVVAAITELDPENERAKVLFP